ncbi:MAG: hypothetical protein V4772_05515 [Pseudomonadota bacterium]
MEVTVRAVARSYWHDIISTIHATSNFEAGRITRQAETVNKLSSKDEKIDKFLSVFVVRIEYRYLGLFKSNENGQSVLALTKAGVGTDKIVSLFVFRLILSISWWHNCGVNRGQLMNRGQILMPPG